LFLGWCWPKITSTVTTSFAVSFH